MICSINSWQRFKHKLVPMVVLLASTMASSPTMALDIMPLGDSITQGYNSCSYRQPLVQALDNISSCSYNMVGSFNTPINIPQSACNTTNVNHEGHGGFTTVNFFQVIAPSTVPRIRAYLNANVPDIVLFHIGTNDMGDAAIGESQVGTYNTSTNQGTYTIGRISQMIDEIYSKNSNAKIFLADLIPVTTDPNYNSYIAQLRTIIGTMVADRASDGNKLYLVPVSSGYTNAMMQDDGIHPNSDGELHIANKFLAAMQSQGICTTTSVPPAVNKIGPSGSTTSNTPTFQWQAVSSASSYYLWVDDAAGNAVRQTLTASNAGCSSGSGNCSFTPSTASYGSSQWWVRAINSAGNGSWGSAMSFSAPAGTIPGTVTLVSPVGGTTGTTPQFRWNAQNSAIKYYLWVNDGSGTRVQQTYTSAQAQCASGSGVCQATPSVTLNSGSIYWWVQASSVSGTGPWSAQASSYIGTLPNTASLLQPSTSGSGSNPTYTWNAVSNSTYYMLWVNEGATNRIAKWYTAAEANCSSGSGTCSITSSTATSGSRTWWIRTWNPAGYGQWSAGKNFN